MLLDYFTIFYCALFFAVEICDRYDCSNLHIALCKFEASLVHSDKSSQTATLLEGTTPAFNLLTHAKVISVEGMALTGV